MARSNALYVRAAALVGMNGVQGVVLGAVRMITNRLVPREVMTRWLLLSAVGQPVRVSTVRVRPV